MCRWLAYSGSPILLEELLYKPAHSLIDQSMHSRLGATTANGDGFGVGWYVDGRPPGVFRAVGPAWSDRNLRELAGHVTSPLFLAHIRASTGTAVQQTNCHPFRHGRWLWVHNGMIRDFPMIKRDLVVAVDPSLYPAIEGSADSEVMFFLALTFGLEDDPPTAVERMVGFVEAVAGKQGIKEPLQMTIGTTDGERVWAFRYSSEGRSRSLFYSTKMHTLRQLYPDNPILHQVAEETRLIVSEPLGDLAGAWNEVPESSYGVVHHGHDELHPFRPRPPGSWTSEAQRVEKGPDKGDEQPEHERHGSRLEGPLTHRCTPTVLERPDANNTGLRGGCRFQSAKLGGDAVSRHPPQRMNPLGMVTHSVLGPRWSLAPPVALEADRAGLSFRLDLPRPRRWP